MSNKVLHLTTILPNKYCPKGKFQVQDIVAWSDEGIGIGIAKDGPTKKVGHF